MQQVSPLGTTAPAPISDTLWEKLKPIIDTFDPPATHSGPPRIDPRAALDAIVYKMVTGCAWNRLPPEFPDDSSVHRTYARWNERGVLTRLLQAIAPDRRPEREALTSERR